MTRLIAFFAIIAAIGYFVVKEFPRDKFKDDTRLDRMYDRMENGPEW